VYKTAKYMNGEFPYIKALGKWQQFLIHAVIQQVIYESD
jgi:hypothetical protein